MAAQSNIYEADSLLLPAGDLQTKAISEQIKEIQNEIIKTCDGPVQALNIYEVLEAPVIETDSTSELTEDKTAQMGATDQIETTNGNDKEVIAVFTEVEEIKKKMSLKIQSMKNLRAYR